jgi:5-formyltetrahydrofolate cyclo-ligase
MPTSIQVQKLVLRDNIRERVRAMEAQHREMASKDACSRVSRQSRWKGANTVLGYAPLPGELDIWPLLIEGLKKGKRVFLPRFVSLDGAKPLKRSTGTTGADATSLKRGVNETETRLTELQSGTYVACEIVSPEKDLCCGRFGIREPAQWCPQFDLNRLDFTLVPGVAFDLQGRRLGRGKGFYDRMLAAVRGTICGVAFDEQIVGEIPIEPHDTRVNCILTPTRWIEL